MRWPIRSLQQSTSDHLKAAMTSLGWLPDMPGWATSPMVWAPDHDAENVAGGAGPAPNTVGISVGTIDDRQYVELGSGLSATNVPVFIDIYGENRPMAMNIMDDITSVLSGDLVTTSRYIPLFDYSTDPPTLTLDMACEARLIQSRWAAQGPQPVEWRKAWRIVNFTATLYRGGNPNDPGGSP
jgi:hypothetical protein